MADIIKADGVEVYRNKINQLADEYIQVELKIDPDDVKEPENKKLIMDNFPDMIFYIADRIQRPSHDDIDLLDEIFEIYKRLCIRYSVLPTLEMFAGLVGIHNSTFSDWGSAKYRINSAHSQTVKKWKAECGAQLVNYLHQSRGGDINKIFVAKAVYQMRETTPIQVGTIDSQAPALSQDEIRQIAEQASQTSTVELLEGLPDE